MEPEPRRREEMAAAVAEIISFNADQEGNTSVRVRRYFRPEEMVTGHRKFHGGKEVLRSDHFELQRADRIRRRRAVHTLEEYEQLEEIRDTDFYRRLDYVTATGKLLPDVIDVYCKCEMPFNPNQFTIRCDRCDELYHPSCINMTEEAAELLEHYICDGCESTDEMDIISRI